MRSPRSRFFLCAVLCIAAAGTGVAQAPSLTDSPESQPAKAQRLFALANEARMSAGAGRLDWDTQLAEAALRHCQRMATEGPIAHRYANELDLTQRAAEAGAHFSVIEENIAVGSYVETIHQGWLDSSEHRANLLNPAVDRVGIAVVAAGGVLFAVADYAHAIPVLTQAQVEARIEGLLRARNLMMTGDKSDARAYCISSGKYQGNNPPSFLVRWQNPDLTQLPQILLDQLVSGRYHKAAVGSCPAQNVDGAFTIYRVAVLLY